MIDPGETTEESFWADPDLVRGIVQTSPVGITVIDADGNVTFVNERAEEIYGRSFEEINEFSHDDPRWDLVDEDGDPLEAGEAPFDQVAAEEEAIYDRVLGLRRPSGERVWVSVNGAPQWNEAGELEHAVFAFEDVTERRKLETELSENYGRITDAFYALDGQWRFTHVNERAAELIGTEPAALVGESIWDVIAWDFDSKLGDEYQRAVETQEPTSFELYYPPRESWYIIHAYPSETGLSVYYRDITERKERERELERAFDLLAKTERIADVGGWEINADTKDVYWTEHLFDVLEVPCDEEPPLAEALDVFHEDDRPIIEEALEEALGTGDGYDVEVRFRTPAGEVRWLRVQGEPEVVDGDVASLRGAAQDVTERKERERDLREAKTQLEAATEAAAVGTWEWNVQEDVLVMGPSFARTFGVDPDAAREGVSLDRFVSALHDDDRERVMANVEAALSSCGEFEQEYRVWNDDGELRWVVARGRVECDEDGNPVTFPGAVTDITERREYQRKLELSNERLEQFAYAASHDLQEPLRMVSSYLQLIENRCGDDLSEEGQEFLEFAVDGAERMRGMIDGLLAYSRVETKGDPFERVDLDAVVEDVLADLTLQIEEHEAEISVGNLPAVRGDAGQLRQVVQNLLDNALEYSGDEPPRIRVSAERDGRMCTVSVEDDGIGIDPDDVDRIFEVFQRLHTQEEHPGTGIGLALCKRIVERHGGEVRVDSEPGRGTTFSFTVPAADEIDRD